MRLLILPFDDKFQVIESDIYELESSSKEEVLKSLNLVIKGKSYQIEVYKNIHDSLFFQLDEEILISAFNYNKKEYHKGVNISAYETMIEIINIYLSENGSQMIRDDFQKEEEIRKTKEKEKYEKWKEKYILTQERDKKTNIKKVGIALGATLILFLFGKLIWDDELRFIGRQTEIKKGVITEIRLMPVRGNKYYQRVTYEFTFDGKTYKNYFTADKYTGMQYEQDSVLIKFDTNNPDRSKFISSK